MPRVLATVGVCLVLGLPSSAAAQATQQKEEPPVVDVSKLPVAPERLQRKLRESLEREELVGNTLRYTVDVFAFAPQIKLFGPEDNLLFGPARSQVPTQRDMMNIVTPQEFRSPVMDFSNLARWLQDRSKSDKK
jgi:hypothetical protein